MDSIVSSALSEICARGANGILLTDLWPTLQQTLTSSGLHLCDGVKSSIWSGLLNIPGLQFQPHSPSLPTQSFKEAESSKLKIIASEHLRDCFVGLYDGDSGISAPHRRALERLAIARTNGITQSQLAKEFDMKGNNIFYYLKNLECMGLVVRHSTIVRTKDNATEGENGQNNASAVNTNLIHLYRYAKHLNSQQRLEITKVDTLESQEADVGGATSVRDDCNGEGIKDDVLVRDYIPALKAVCDKLDEADDKILVVLDIKQSLGYRKPQGHRAWRNICRRLKEVGLVEELNAEVNKKVVSCLRLLKKFDPKIVDPKSVGCTSDDFDVHQVVKCGKRGQITDQLLELPIEHQIYDMIDAEGSKGLTVAEVCKRLGVTNKKAYARLFNVFSRFGMHLEAESHNKTVQYRFWTSRNFTNISTVTPGMPEDGLEKVIDTTSSAMDLMLHEGSDPITPRFDSSTSKIEFRTVGEMKTGLEDHCYSAGDVESNQMVTCGSSPHDLNREIVASSSNPPKLNTYPSYPSTQREQRILQHLQEDKFILKAELYRWLESLDKDKPTPMARKTLDRTLTKLQQEGHCKCIHVSIPAVTNYGHSRTTEVVLHKSLQSLSPEVFSQLQERMRSFDMQIRGQGISRMKNEKAVPILTNIRRTTNPGRSDTQSIKTESMRANGFVIAKMVRAKLLHNFLWKFLKSSPDWCDSSLSGRHGYDLKNPHSTCKLFAMDVAVKAMPLELFLQVVGSTQKFEDLVASCKHNLCLADLPLQKYQSLMDTQATGRLSSVIDILRRLKLIRVVTDGHQQDGDKMPSKKKDGDKIPCAILTYAMELKPYIEEPLSSVSLSIGVSSVDLRPRIRHDFILSKKEAVDIYWNTLEYCYATVDPKAAVHAFPGSAVHEVFLFRSWAAVRVMTADQRAQLLKRIVKDDPNRKISFADCCKIARDLNLTVEQVLRVSNDKRQSRLNRFRCESNLNEQEMEPIKSNCISASQKRKKSRKARSSKRVKSCKEIGESSIEKVCAVSDDGCKYGEHNLEDNDLHLQEGNVDTQTMTAEDSMPIVEDGEENCDFISQGASSRWRSSRQRRFFWTDTSDRKLVIQYVKHRAALGAKFNRTDWVSLPDLPAPPDTCRRRMSLLNSNSTVRRSIMRLCNLLGERYGKHLGKSQQKVLLTHNDARQMVQESPEALNRIFSSCIGTEEANLKEQQWDDFEDPHIKVALDEVLRCKQTAKLEASRKGVLTPEKEWSDRNLDAEACNSQEETEMTPTTVGEKSEKYAGRRSRCHRLPGKFLKLLNEGISISRRAYESLAVANAVELLKLVFLSNSTAVEVPSLLADTLRRYSEHDLFAAFNYLREKKFMVGGNGSQPFVLSQQFLHCVSSSPFPMNTGKRASKFVSWLQEREKDLMEEAIHLDTELQCGDIVHMLALVSSGELCISPSLPEEGIGEAEENRSLKRKADEDELRADDVKRLKHLLTQDGEVGSRRAKGFPGIKISVTRATLSGTDAVSFFKNENVQASSSFVVANDETSILDVEIGGNVRSSDLLKPSSIISVEMAVEGSLWKALSSYSEHLLSTFSDNVVLGPLNSGLFKTVHSTIHKAGDQGLSMNDICQVLPLKGERLSEFVIDVLQAFGLAVKVNGYNCVHVVDATFRSKYFLTSVDGRYQDLKPSPYMKSPRTREENTSPIPQECNSTVETSGVDDVHKVTILNLPEQASHVSREENTSPIPQECNSTVETSGVDDVHKVTILNLPEQASHVSRQVQNCIDKDVEECVQVGVSIEDVNESQVYQCTTFGNSHSFNPILPWVNGDGTINQIVYKGLTRRVLGIVMQAPGILEGDIIRRMDVLNPQSCRKLLELMVLDNHLLARKMHQTVCSKPPSLLGNLFGGTFKKSKSIYREHYFANPMSTTSL